LPLFSYGEKAAAASLLTPAGARCGTQTHVKFSNSAPLVKIEKKSGEIMHFFRI
jgi:hypothetical protein